MRLANPELQAKMSLCWLPCESPKYLKQTKLFPRPEEYAKMLENRVGYFLSDLGNQRWPKVNEICQLGLS